MQINNKLFPENLTGEFASLVKTDSQSIPVGTYTTVVLDTFNTSKSSIFSKNGNGIKVSKSGKYLVCLAANIESTTADWKIIGIGINNTNISSAQQMTSSAIGVSLSATNILSLNANDTVYINAYNYGGNLNITEVHHVTKIILIKLL